MIFKSCKGIWWFVRELKGIQGYLRVYKGIKGYITKGICAY